MYGYKKLKVWELSIELASGIYKLVGSFPNSERFGLSSQMRRCSVSISSNIAEGASRTSRKEFLHFLSIATGSLAELETQFIIASRVGYIKEEFFEYYLNLMNDIGALLSALKKSLQLITNNQQLTTKNKQTTTKDQKQTTNN